MADQPDHRERRWRNSCRKWNGNCDERCNRSVRRPQQCLEIRYGISSAGSPYDLSTKGGSTARNTANSYLISAPGHYRIPLVYGNAIKNGGNNTGAYQTGNTAPYCLNKFKDHNDQDITDPWIEKTNGGANAGINGAKIVWADEKDLVHLSASPIKQDGGNAYLDFEVKQADIKSGNAVVAVTKNGTVVWSWHLWFAPKDALSTIAVTNYQARPTTSPKRPSVGSLKVWFHLTLLLVL
ncbi:hypothetical protein [Hoylesella enoeca]|uniref:hypothetical protein n=1 Tax=Hoylesella enoeca TaxID=76123 RepID=UPI000AEA6556|nr:hypothetical protein [Hoylesella enoeca]